MWCIQNVRNGLSKVIDDSNGIYGIVLLIRRACVLWLELFCQLCSELQY
jgi:hypothetical protein